MSTDFLLRLAGVPAATLAHLIAAAAWLADRLQRSAGDALQFLDDVRHGLDQIIEDLLGWLRTINLGAIPDWAHDQVSRLHDWVRRLAELLQHWGEDFIALADNLQVFRDGLQDAFGELASWLSDARRTILDDVPAWIAARAQDLIDWANGRLQELGTWVDGSLASLGDWVRSRLDDLGTWVDGSLASLRDWLAARLQDLRDWTTALLQGIRDWVDARLDDLRTWTRGLLDAALQPLHDWIASWQSLLDWLHAGQAQLQALLEDPWAYLFAQARQVLWPHVEHWLQDVWDGPRP